MAKNYFFWFCIFLGINAQAQIISIPDANFKAKLLEANLTNGLAKDADGNNIVIDVNTNGEIEVSEALTVRWLFFTPPPPFRLNGNGGQANTTLQDFDISDLTGIEYFTNLQKLDISQNNLTSLDVTALTQLMYLNCSSNALTSLTVNGLSNLTTLDTSVNQLTSLNVTGLNALVDLNCGSNQLAVLNISNLTNLARLSCYSNQMTQLICANNTSLDKVSCSQNLFVELDFSNTSLRILDCYGNPNLTFLNIKNGYGTPVWVDMLPLLGQYPGLSVPNTVDYICHDEFELNPINAFTLGIQNISRGTYCNFEPGGNHNTVTGIISYDCMNSNSLIGNQAINVMNGSQSGYTTTAINGNYIFYTGLGNTVVTPQFTSDYFTMTPSNFQVTYTGLGNTTTANFCLTANGSHPDLEVYVYPLNPARPGFDAKYKVIYRNKGNQVQSGSVAFTYDDNLLDFVTADPSADAQITNGLRWDFTNLLPFEIREVLVTLNVNAPTDTPPVNNDDMLQYSVALTTAMADETPSDNEMNFNQTVVGSFDPNDKTVVEGSLLSIADVGDYLHYIVRFQNTGTYMAENVVIKDMLSNTLDWNTLEIVSSSHPYRNTLTNGNQLEVFYQNINLPPSNIDEPGSHGYVAFKIKPKATIAVNDVIQNTANIYFDFNFPIVTNTVNTTVTALETADFTESAFVLHPNPTKDFVNIVLPSNDSLKKATIYNALGQKLISGNTVAIDVNSLSQGTYFISVETHNGSSTQKFVKL